MSPRLAILAGLLSGMVVAVIVLGGLYALAPDAAVPIPTVEPSPSPVASAPVVSAPPSATPSASASAPPSATPAPSAPASATPSASASAVAAAPADGWDAVVLPVHLWTP